MQSRVLALVPSFSHSCAVQPRVPSPHPSHHYSSLFLAMHCYISLLLISSTPPPLTLLLHNQEPTPSPLPTLTHTSHTQSRGDSLAPEYSCHCRRFSHNLTCSFLLISLKVLAVQRTISPYSHYVSLSYAFHFVLVLIISHLQRHSNGCYIGTD